MDEVEHAVSCFEDGFSCSQAVLSAYAGRFGLDREMALKVSGAFGGGMGHLGETCGAVTGAFMLIGLKYGKTRVGDEQRRDKAHSLVREFAREFKSRNGSIMCRELLGCDISTSEGMKLAEENELFITRCPRFVRDAAEIIEQILL
jgi:C_GCAxxG_C_C family probable redox protein